MESKKEASARLKKWRQENPEKFRANQRKYELKVLYGLTPEGFDDHKALLRLAKEFEADAESMERLAVVYQRKGMTEQYQVLWHEGATYRNCADRLKWCADKSHGVRYVKKNLRGVCK